jgi:6-phosphofructokinase 1
VAVHHIGVYTSGGDAPGMNAAIRAVVRASHFHSLKVSGIMGGYDGMIRNDMRVMGPRDVSNIVQRGGTVLRSARSEAFRTAEGRAKAAANLRAAGIDALVAIGGNGTLTGAMTLQQEHAVRVMGVASTVDNDLFGTDRSIGFDTACNTALEAIDRIRDTASSHNRLFFVEVMGRDRGFIALRCALAAGAEYVMLPERKEGIDELIQALQSASKARPRASWSWRKAMKKAARSPWRARSGSVLLTTTSG